MPQNTKIATCCYCGTRAALVLKGNDRHELSCSSCGAPLHDLKIVPAANIDKKAHKAKPSKKKGAAATPNPLWEKQKTELHQRKRKKPKKRKNSIGYFLRDALDDVFDEIFD